jgi:hypothetical protein
MLQGWANHKEANSAPDAAMTDQEIIKRFRLLFGRDMTPRERQIFFLPDDDTSFLGKEE